MGDPIRVLIVEDQFFFRLALRTTIGDRLDMAVIGEAARGDEAVELHARVHPDVVLMDLRLPGQSGFDAISAIHRSNPKTAILVLSNYEGSEDVHRALIAGAMGYLTKDVGAAELVRAIQTVHAGKRYLSAFVGALLAERLPFSDLTDREQQVLELIARGYSNKQISDALRIAEKTTKIHVSHILDKLAVTDRTQAAVLAIVRGLVHLDGNAP